MATESEIVVDQKKSTQQTLIKIVKMTNNVENDEKLINQARGEILEYAKNKKLNISFTLFTHLVSPIEILPWIVEVGFVLKNKVKNVDLPLQLGLLPAGEYQTITHKGKFEELESIVHPKLLAWRDLHHKVLTSACFEFFRNDVSGADNSSKTTLYCKITDQRKNLSR